MSELISLVLVIAVSFTFLFIISIVLRPLIFLFEPVFSLINQVLWILNNPARTFMKNPERSRARGFFLLITFTGLSLAWFVVFYILSFPLRLITAIYYDVLLFLAVSLSDTIQELVNPKRGEIREKKGASYLARYILGIPFRLVTFAYKNIVYLLDSFLMLGVGILLPTLTMRHGTQFREAGTKIAQSGNWLVGSGNYAGTGLYFGMQNRVAMHYAEMSNHHDTSVILARVTLTFTKTIASLQREYREVGLGQKGEEIALAVKSPLFASTEHWRVDHGWWEYCILKPRKMGEFVNTWRVRPVAIIKNNKVVRTWGGFSHYSAGGGFFAGIISWGVILWAITKV